MIRLATSRAFSAVRTNPSASDPAGAIAVNHTSTAPDTTESRTFLLYCPTYQGDYLGEFFGSGRLFDVALNDYSGEGKGTEGAEYRFAEKGHKWPCLHRNLQRIGKPYEYYAIFDPDLQISTAALNSLFVTGYAL